MEGGEGRGGEGGEGAGCIQRRESKVGIEQSARLKNRMELCSRTRCVLFAGVASTHASFLLYQPCSLVGDE